MLKNFKVRNFARIFVKTHSIESRCAIGPVCRRVRASFSPEILQSGAVKELTSTETIRLIRDRGRWGRVGGGGGGII